LENTQNNFRLQQHIIAEEAQTLSLTHYVCRSRRQLWRSFRQR